MKIAEVRQRMTECMRLQRLSPTTIKSYLSWVDQFAAFVACQSVGVTHEEKVSAFLSRQVNRNHVAAATQKQALCALVYLFKNVLNTPLGDLSFCRSRRTPRLPAVFSRQEVWRVLDRLDGEGWLWGALMYGCGSRLSEVCNLRVKDIDLDRSQVTIRQGKGDKDRVVPLPTLLQEPLRKQLRRDDEQWQDYHDRHIAVPLPDRLDRKYPAAPYSWEWFWLFPASGPCADPKWHGHLWHIHPTAVQKRIRAAIVAAKIPKKAGCHTFRHSFATHWLENAEGSHEVALLQLQRLLGHNNPKTTMVYLHLVARTEVKSPLDARPEQKRAA